jgi:hypothetical protein
VSLEIDTTEGREVMWISKRALLATLVAAVGALSMLFVAGALGTPGHGHGKGPKHEGARTGAPLIDESLAPSMPSDPMFHGVTAGGFPWVLRSGTVRLKRDGKLDVRVRGLVIPTAPFTGTPGPVTSISASLYCGLDTNAMAADTTHTFPISRAGNARIRDDSFIVPATCLAPMVLVHPNGLGNMYIALDGWRL